MIDQLREVVQQVRFWGARGLTRAFHYALLDTRAAFRRKRPSGPFRSVGRPLRFHPLASGARIEYEDAQVELRFLLPDLVRVTWQPGLLPVPYGTLEREWPEVRVQVRETATEWELTTRSLTVDVAKDGSIVFLDEEGKRLRQELPPERRGVEWRQQARLAAGEHLYGLGERTGAVDLRGSKQRLWNSDPMASYGPDRSPLYLNIPVYQALHRGGGYLVFFENSFPATFSFGKEPQAHTDGESGPHACASGTAQAHFEGGALRYYFTPGTPGETLERYTRLTGRPPLPPRWALGYHQSRFSYQTESEVREVASGFLDHGLPLSAIHLDIHYMDGFRVFTVDGERFPDLRGLAHELLEQGVRLVVILDPGIKRDPDYRIYREGIERDMFCRTVSGHVAVGPVWPGWCVFPDFTDPRVREWWSEQYQCLVESGIAGFWHDMNEPTLTALWGERALAHDVEHDLDGRGGDHFEAHNLYGLLMTRAGYKALRKLHPERRPFLLSRSGWAGIQRYAWTWTGDISSSWEMMRQTIATVLGLGLSGVPYSGPDIGGFKGSLGDEQYLRWFELATFLPFYRTHSAILTPRREPWRFGPEMLQHIRRLLELRMELMPYLYTLAWEASRTGHPLVRPLFWVNGADEHLWDVDDSFLLGNALLVAPVLAEGDRRRTVQLPFGGWYGFWDDSLYEGEADVEAPLGRPPLFVRSGSVLPREEEDGLVLHVYPPVGGAGPAATAGSRVRSVRSTGSEGGFVGATGGGGGFIGATGGVLYSDEGDGYGSSRVDRFELHGRAGELRLSWRGEGEYPFPYGDVILQFHGVVPRELLINGESVASKGSRAVTGVFDEAVAK